MTSNIVVAAGVLPSVRNWVNPTWGGGRWCVVSYNSRAASSADGLTWTEVALPAIGGTWSDVAYGAGVFCAVSDGFCRTTTSVDGVTWSAVVSLGSLNTPCIAYNGVFCILATSAVLTSADGTVWTNHGAPAVTADGWGTLVPADVGFYAMGERAGAVVVAYSADGVNWAELAGTSAGYGSGLAVTGDTVVVPQSAAASADVKVGAAPWAPVALDAADMRVGGATGGVLGVVGDQCYLSGDGLTWEAHTLPLNAAWSQPASDGTDMLVVGFASNLVLRITPTYPSTDTPLFWTHKIKTTEIL